MGLATITATVGGIPATLSNVLQVGTQPAPTSLQIAPAGVNMLMGDTQQFDVVDNTGMPRPDAAWSIDNTDLATITTSASPLGGNSVALTAIAAGTVTLTATVQGDTTQIPVTISSATSFPIGTVLWSAPPVSGFSALQIAQAMPSEFGPSTYSIQKSSGGTQTLIEAFTSDGQLMWQSTVRALASNAVPDGFGGLLVTEVCDGTNNLPLDIIDLDAVTGAQLWTATVAMPTNGACPLGAPKIAIRQDGAVVIANPLQVSPALVVVDGKSATVLSTPTIPPSILINVFGQSTSCDCFTPVGQPIVDSDGSIYVGYEVREIPRTSAMSSVLSLLKIGADGSTMTTQLSSSTGANLFPGNIIPDGQGGILATWAIANANPPSAPQPYQAAYVSGGTIAASYPLPNAPTNLATGPDGLPINPPLAVGENGTTGFASYGINLASFVLGTGSTNWNYSAPSQNSLTTVTVTPGNGLATKMTDQNGIDQIVQFDETGNPTMSVGVGSNLSYSWHGDWNGFSSGTFASLLLTQVTPSSLTGWAMPGANSSGNGVSVNNESFGLFWCGTSSTETGPCSDRNDGDDVVFDYLPNNKVYLDSKPISSYNPIDMSAQGHPEFVEAIQSEALKAFKRAFEPLGIKVQKGTLRTGSQVPQQNFNMYVVGHWPTPGAGKTFLTTQTSNVYYFTALLNGQTALQTLPGSGFSTPPTWPPTAQNVGNYFAMMSAIGKGLGNAAAHEIGHHLHEIHPSKGGFFGFLNTGEGFPYMDCGPLNPEGAIQCQNNNNFVYNFWTTNGVPQDPNDPTGSGGGSFFYVDIPGHPIHWGPDNVCWLVNWTIPGGCQF